MKEQKLDHYIPGVCNIGPAEIKWRKQWGYASLVVTLLLVGFLVIRDAHARCALLVFFPAFGAAIGLLQAYLHFCAHFGVLSVSNFKERFKENRETIERAKWRKMDQNKALKIIGLSVLFGVLASGLTYLLLGM